MKDTPIHSMQIIKIAGGHGIKISTSTPEGVIFTPSHARQHARRLIQMADDAEADDAGVAQ